MATVRVAVIGPPSPALVSAENALVVNHVIDTGVPGPAQAFGQPGRIEAVRRIMGNVLGEHHAVLVGIVVAFAPAVRGVANPAVGVALPVRMRARDLPVELLSCLRTSGSGPGHFLSALKPDQAYRCSR